jgi:flagellar basal body-associated protein FliL
MRQDISGQMTAKAAPSTSKAAGNAKSDKVKLIVAMGLLIAAAAVLGWYFTSGGTPTPPPPPPAATADTGDQPAPPAAESGKFNRSGTKVPN